jgi:hypothetical protein
MVFPILMQVGSLDERKDRPPNNAGCLNRRSREDTDPDIRSTIPKSKNIIACTQSRARAQNARKKPVPTQCRAKTGVARNSNSVPHIKSGVCPLQIVFGVRALLASMTSSRWLHMATNRSKNSFPLPSPYTSLPHFSISACMVPLRLKVLRHRMMSAR